MNIKNSFLLIYPIIIIGVFGLFTPRGYNILPANLFFELVAFSTLMLVSWNFKKRIIFLITFIITYVIYFYAHSILMGVVVMSDIFISVKSYIYLLLICLVVGKSILSQKDIENLLAALLLLFSLKYTYSLIFGISARPGVFAENNFELMMLFILSIGIRELRGYLYKAEVSALLFIVLLSNSMSGVLTLIFLLLSGFLTKNTQKISKGKSLIIFLFTIPCAVLLALFVFVNRDLNDIESIDRYKFLLSFVDETESWIFSSWIFGSPPLTALSSATCASLQYYQDLFSASGNGVCYSVILHSMLLRTVFDHGLLGLLINLSIIWVALGESRYGQKTRFQIIGLLIINGLSVSSYNSIYAALSIILLVLVNRKTQSS